MWQWGVLFRSHYCLIANRKETQRNNQSGPPLGSCVLPEKWRREAHLEDNKHNFSSRPELLWTSVLNVMLTTETSSINKTKKKKKTTLQGKRQKAVDWLSFFFSQQNLQICTSTGSSSYMLSQLTVCLRSVLDIHILMSFDSCGTQTFCGNMAIKITWQNNKITIPCFAAWVRAETGSLENQKWDQTWVVVCRLMPLRVFDTQKLILQHVRALGIKSEMLSKTALIGLIEWLKP